MTSLNMLRSARDYLDRVIEEQEIDLADPYHAWADPDAQREYIAGLREVQKSIRTTGGKAHPGLRIASVPIAAAAGTAALDYAATENYPDRDPLIFTDTLIVF